MKRMRALLSGVAVMILVGTTSFTPVKEDVQGDTKVKWYTFEEAVAASKKNPKKIFIDVYTDWCGWCKRMDAGTFNHPEIAKYLNDKYYPVKLDAEQRADIEFNDHTFKWVKGGRRGVHELAYSLLQGKMSYPTVVFMDEKFRILSPVPGYLKVEQFDPIIRYYGENKHKTTPWNEYQESYVKSF